MTEDEKRLSSIVDDFCSGSAGAHLSLRMMSILADLYEKGIRSIPELQLIEMIEGYDTRQSQPKDINSTLPDAPLSFGTIIHITPQFGRDYKIIVAMLEARTNAKH